MRTEKYFPAQHGSISGPACVHVKIDKNLIRTRILFCVLISHVVSSAWRQLGPTVTSRPDLKGKTTVPTAPEALADRFYSPTLSLCPI